ncbi:arylsulfatase [Myxococcota bacterium]|nr:arylsulfatase [Myxococcota bacterium]
MRSLAFLCVVLVLACASSPPTRVEPTRPNLLVIIADDLGYADLGSYGSEIPTPHIDRLARDGVQLTNFHVAATCSPTRAMLITGVDNHRNGLGSMHRFMTEEQRGQPGYEGHLNQRVATLGEILGAEGYDTFFSGKWHLGTQPESFPSARGFDRSYALLVGSGDNWSDAGPAPIEPKGLFTEDGQRVERPAGPFSTELFTDKLLGYLREARTPGKPFVGLLSFQAVHWPHQAPAADVSRHIEEYHAGWDDLREARVKRMRDLGLVAEDAPYQPRAEGIPAWDSLSDDEQRWEAHRMAAYAGMTENMDHHIGRLLQYLEDTGELDDTLIVFVSDNGPDPSEPDQEPRAKAWYATFYPNQTLENTGGPGSFPSYGPQWAQLGSGNLRGFKGGAFEGGLRVPFLAHWPAGLPPGQRSDAFAYVTDIVPTLLDAAGVQHPAPHFEGHPVHAPDGRSLLPLLMGQSQVAHPPEEAIGYELMKNRALFQDGYKLVRVGPPAGDGSWKLFQLDRDPFELNDLAKVEPERVARMRARYDAYATEMGVIDMPDDYDVFRALTTEAPDAQ